MVWQDTVLSVAAVVFFLALVPSMIDKTTRIPRRTSIPTATAVWAQAATFATLGLLFTTFATLLIAVAWTYIAIARSRGADPR